MGRLSYSAVISAASVVPQGSVLGPILFPKYVSLISCAIGSFQVIHHSYANDMQLYATLNPLTAK